MGDLSGGVSISTSKQRGSKDWVSLIPCMVPPGVPPRVGFVDFEPLHQSQEWLTVPFWNRLSVDHMTDAFWINRIQFSSQTGGGTLTLRGGYPRFRVRESGHRTFRLATQILHAYRMVHKINTDRLYEMHGTPGGTGTMRDPELKIVVKVSIRACMYGSQVAFFCIWYSNRSHDRSKSRTASVGH